MVLTTELSGCPCFRVAYVFVISKYSGKVSYVFSGTEDVRLCEVM